MQNELVEARARWLQPSPDMKEIERVYRCAVESIPTAASGSRGKKRQREDASSTITAEWEDWQKRAMEQFCMILCQSGRANEAKPWLQSLGYTCRLASCVLDYPTPMDDGCATSTATSYDKHSPRQVSKPTIACHVWDHLLGSSQLKLLQEVFHDPQADYWLSHNYQVEPPSKYFSYVIPLQRHKTKDNTLAVTVDDKFGCLGTILTKLHSHLIPQFPKLSTATAVELWAHNRPHPTGHQFHFDSDNEGQGRMIKNPIMTAIVYLSAGSSGGGGGPSVITSQAIVSRHLASRGVLCHASTPGRVVAFEGNLLHGVIPGKASGSCSSGGSNNNCRRVTLMLAYWRRIRVRASKEPGAARPYPMDKDDAKNKTKKTLCSSWHELLIRPLSEQDDEDKTTTTQQKKMTAAVERDPIPIDHVYETLEGEPWTKAMGFPEYDQVYQGF
jgi:hypothetical protein